MSASSAISWLNPRDLIQRKVFFRATNTTTQAKLADDAVELSCIHENSLTFTAGIQSCAFGHHLFLEGWLFNDSPLMKSQNEDDVFALSFTGKIVDEQVLDSKKKVVTISLFQFDPKQLERLVREVNSQQHRVGRIVKNITGVE